MHGPGSDEQTAFSRGFCAALATRSICSCRIGRSEFGGDDADGLAAVHPRPRRCGRPASRAAPQYMNVNWIGPVADALRHRGSSSDKLPAADRARRGHLVPGLLRAVRRLGPCGAAHARRAGRGRLPRHRRKDLDLLRRPCRHLLPAGAHPAPDGAQARPASSSCWPTWTSPGIQVQADSQPDRRGRHPRSVLRRRLRARGRRGSGDEGQAWEIIDYALQNERVGIPRYEFSRRMLDRAVAKLKAAGRWSDPVVQDTGGPRADALRSGPHAGLPHRRRQGARLAARRLRQPRALGRRAWPTTASTISLPSSCPEGLLGDDPVQQAHHQRAIAAGIASGAAEIQLNLIAAQRWLELPRERARR